MALAAALAGGSWVARADDSSPAPTSSRRSATIADDSDSVDAKLRWRPVRQIIHEEELPASAAPRQLPADDGARALRPTTPRSEAFRDPFGDCMPRLVQLTTPAGAADPLAPRPMAEPALAPAQSTDPFGAPAARPPAPMPAMPDEPMPLTPPSSRPMAPTPTAPALPGPSAPYYTPGAETPPATPKAATPAPSLEAERSSDAAPQNCVQARKDCQAELTRLKEHTLDKVSIDISVAASLKTLKVEKAPTMGDNYPCECTFGHEAFEPRQWACTCFTWKASALCHKPLYFEDVQMERYGHSWGPLLDPIVEAGRFFLTIPILPYEMGMETPNECVYALGYYRPGDCAPYVIDAIPWSPRGALFEAAAVTGFVFAWP